jgi:hypothetical protein
MSQSSAPRADVASGVATPGPAFRFWPFGATSGQGMANHFGIVPITAAELTSGLPANEQAVLNSSNGLLLQKTPLWYYVLREAAVVGGGTQLGPVGGRIGAETFVRILKRDAAYYLNVAGGFSPILPSADLVAFAGVTQH